MEFMKIKNLFVLSLAALSFVACSNEDDPIVPQEGSLVIDLTSVAAVSKAEGTETGIGDESDLQNVYVYAFDSNGALYGTPQVATVNSAKTSASLTWQLPVGTYTIAAVSGVETAFTGVNSTTLPQQVVALTANTRSNFVMYGNATGVTITAPTADKKDPATAEIKVARVLAGVKLVDIKTAFKTGVPAEYLNATKTLSSIKIVGSKESALLSGAVKTDATATDDDDMTKATFTGGNAVTITADGGVDNEFTTAARAYACPGSITRITIGVNFEGVDERFYSVSTSDLVYNTMYGLDITITGIGSEDPNQPTPVGSGEITITPQDWTTGTVIEGSTDY